MATTNGEDNLGADRDDFYNALIDTHAGLSEADSHALNARLVLLMANEIGDITRLTKLLETAKSYSE